jgi:hypothetical protein
MADAACGAAVKSKKGAESCCLFFRWLARPQLLAIVPLLVLTTAITTTHKLVAVATKFK